MKRLSALFCTFVMLLAVCGCTTTSTTTITSTFEDGNDSSVSDVSNGSSIENEGGNQVGNNQGGNNQGGSNSQTGNENTGSNSVIDNPLDVDLKGATIVVYDSCDIFTADATASKTEKAKADLINKLQKELNCKLQVKTVDDDKLKNLAATSASAGKAIGGIITSRMYSAGSYISSNLVADLCKVSSLDLSKDYMNRGDVLNATGFGKGKYAVGGNTQGRTLCVFYNKRILKELGHGSNYIYDLVDNGKWTLSAYRNLAKDALKDLDGKSGMSANDQWGQVMQDASSGVAPNIVASLGVKKINLVNGKLVLNMTDSKIMQALELSRDLITNDGSNYSEVRGDTAVEFFGAGKSLFLYAYGTKASMLSKMKDEFGVAPPPKVDGAKDYTNAVDGNVGTLMIPAGLSAKDQYNAGAVIQAYNYLFSSVLETQKKEYVNRYFCDDESGENWLLAVGLGTTEPTHCYSRVSEAILSGTERVFWNYIEKGDSPAAAIESTKGAAQIALDEFNEKIKDK